MRTWHNVYNDRTSVWNLSPKVAQFFSYDSDGQDNGFVRVEEHWNGHPLRPCVGMQAGQASHEWVVETGNGTWQARPKPGSMAEATGYFDRLANILVPR